LDIDFVHTESVVDYNESYSFSGPDMKALNNSKIMTFNHAGLSVWHQLKTRPNFLNAFKGMNEMKNLWIKSDPYYRYFTKNIHLLAYSSLPNLVNSVFFGLSQGSQEAIFNDNNYGFKTTKTLYKWVLAMDGGKSSVIYQDILKYFAVTKGLSDFNEGIMDQIVGDHSMMLQLNNTFSFSIGYELF